MSGSFPNARGPDRSRLGVPAAVSLSMRYAGRLDDPVAIEPSVTDIAISLQDAAKVAQVGAWMLALAVGRAAVERRWRIIDAAKGRSSRT
jgi:hypothetical protein